MTSEEMSSSCCCVCSVEREEEEEEEEVEEVEEVEVVEVVERGISFCFKPCLMPFLILSSSSSLLHFSVLSFLKRLPVLNIK